jgi:site-specific DNA-methyltransferase (adenine-specific)
MVQPNIIQDRLQELFPVHYRNGNILMINADCMDVMKHIQNKEVELSCVDPPYGIGEDGSKNVTRGTKRVLAREYKGFYGEDKSIPEEKYFNELFRVSQNQIIWGGNYMTKYLPGSMGWIFWDKDKHNDFSDGEFAFTSFNRASRCFRYTWDGFRQGDKSQSIEKRIHPTQKPVALYRWLLSRYAKPGDSILDTHGGSGSICIACHDLGYDLTWMELDADYYAAAVARYQIHASQGQLFEPKAVQPRQGVFA